jgi:eukaryotic-like serine/threonine-protein kinase
VADDRYELLDELGRGNFGVVVRARQVHLDRIYALKIIRVRAEPARALDEARLLAALPEHDNVVKVHDAGLWDDSHVFIASELCTGGSLDDVAAAGPLDPGKACDLISQACRGLGHLHHDDLLHLDIRPANILMADGTPRLVDFGLARLVDDAEVDDWYSPHAAPELVEAGRATPAADIYSMAMTLAHLLTGGRICRPFPSGAELVEASADGDWPRLDELTVNVPARIRKLIDAATQYDADARPRSIGEFKQLLDRATPATSFLAPDDHGTLLSSDGDWSITTVDKRGSFDVEVRRGGRRRNQLGAESMTVAKARAHVTKLVRLFAEGAP